MSMDGRYAGLSRPSMASEALGLLPVGNAGAIAGDVHGWTVCRPLSAIHGLRGTRAPARRQCRSNCRRWPRMSGMPPFHGYPGLRGPSWPSSAIA